MILHGKIGEKWDDEKKLMKLALGGRDIGIVVYDAQDDQSMLLLELRDEGKLFVSLSTENLNDIARALRGAFVDPATSRRKQ